ncbi:lipase member H-A-like [Musca vetustissima]|uniref:lipase member H-A-like n=1 Tax=Musca vetustissima TaxID=27455 RepID=UPI002AB6F668|nr:lipase member H-A-like [Musca vetustissima]
MSGIIFPLALFAVFPTGIHTAVIGHANVKDSVKYYVYTRQNPDIPQPLEANVESVIRNVLNPTKPTTLSIHGIADNKDHPMNILVKNAKLQLEDGNVIVVDYSEVIENSDDLAAGALKVPQIAEALADLVYLLHDSFNLDLQQLHAVGFSLGAQISGVLGHSLHQRVQQKLARITALDPAGVFFNESTPHDERLTADDADFVEVVHTNAGYLGFRTPCGHVDYYPNGGVQQPGCDVKDVSCSHIRAYQLITEMWLPVENQELLVLKCPSYTILDLTSCRWLAERMGDLKYPAKDGVYYVETNAVEPYGKGAFKAEFL